jgi:hypothetical protein
MSAILIEGFITRDYPGFFLVHARLVIKVR